MDNNDRQKLTVEIWKTIVGVQQHFNDISMRIRSMFVTILLALFAAIGFLVDKRITLEVFERMFSTRPCCRSASLAPSCSILSIAIGITDYW